MLLQKIKSYCLLSLFFLIALFAGCEKHFNSIEEYEKYVKSEDSPYAQTITRNGVKVTLRFLPTDVLMINQLKAYEEEKIKVVRDTSLSAEQKNGWIKKEKNELAQYRKNYDNGVHFMLTFVYEDEDKDIVYEKGRAGFESYNEWVQKLLFKLDKYIYINSETAGEIPPSLIHTERNFGIFRHTNTLFEFTKSVNNTEINDEDGNVKIIVKEFGLGTGPLIFDFNILKKTNYKLF